ncbi:MAG: hypothetical protein ACO1OG_05155 [Devosia sp.]
MKLPLISSIALAAALLAGPALAQTVINGVTIPEDELARVQAQCDKLDRLDNTGNSATNDSDSKEAEQPSTMAEQLVQSIDLETLTLEACKTAGLVAE